MTECRREGLARSRERRPECIREGRTGRCKEVTERRRKELARSR
ncbi:MAG: hypothetical protein PUC56_02960 [Bacteroidales bacterium]|nr:hypothetical protein [Bacteroidales bacterium]